MSTISTHVLDTALGKPAVGVHVGLRRVHDGATLGSGVTDTDGRVSKAEFGVIEPGTYRLHFDTAAYFAQSARETFYPEITVVFRVGDGGGAHFHVPLLLSPFGYSTYRGS